MDIKKLEMDCVAARKAAISASDDVDDGGSANLDATFMPLGKGVRAKPIVDAIMRAGLRASPTRWIGRGVMIQPPGHGQGNKRWAANNEMLSVLTVCGWEVIGYYQMD